MTTLPRILPVAVSRKRRDFGMKKIPVILEGDPGHDDAMAWVLANASPELDIRMVASSCGNQTIEKTT